MRRSDAILYARLLRQRETKAEKEFWKRTRNRRFLGIKFYRQYVIEHSVVFGNRMFFIADFYTHVRRTVVELDGMIHLQQKSYDNQREEILRSMGYVIVRFTNKEVLEDWSSVESVMISHFGRKTHP